MDSITVTCSCTRQMKPFGAKPGALRCGCGRTVTVEVPTTRRENQCRLIVGKGVCPRDRMPGLDICDKHALRAASVVLDNPEMRAELLDGQIERELVARLNADGRKQTGGRAARDEVSARQQGTVYYIRMSEKVIKIGYTADLPTRMKALRVISQRQVLATEPGGTPLEAQRHREFKGLRYPGRREEYLPGPELLAHIDRVLELHGEPSLA